MEINANKPCSSAARGISTPGFDGTDAVKHCVSEPSTLRYTSETKILNHSYLEKDNFETGPENLDVSTRMFQGVTK